MSKFSQEQTKKKWVKYYQSLANLTDVDKKKLSQEIAKYTNTHTWFNSLRIIEEKINIKEGDDVLDAGSGWGRLLLGLLRNYSKVRFLAVDYSQEALELGQKLIGGERNENSISWKQGDLHSLPFPDNSFNAVYSARVFQHLSSPQKAATEIVRVLRPGGKFVVFLQNRWCLLNVGYYARLFSPLEVKQWFSFLPNTTLNISTMDFFPSFFCPKFCNKLTLAIEKTIEKAPLINNFGGKVVVWGEKLA